MRPVAHPGRGVGELARLLFCRGNIFSQCRIGQRRPDQYDGWQVRHMDDRREGGVGVVGQLAERVRYGVGPDLGEEQGVTVRLLARHGACREGAAGAGPILHDQRLPVGQWLKAVRQVSRQRIGRAARADRYQEPNWALGPLCRRLRKGGHRGESGNRKGSDPDDLAAHKPGERHGISSPPKSLLVLTYQRATSTAIAVGGPDRPPSGHGSLWHV